jgi:hypothetical protein
MTKPFLHLYLFAKIKEGTKLEVVDKDYIRETIGRIILRKGGLPKCMVKYIIEDMVNLELITPISGRGVYRLSDKGEERRIRKLLAFF